MSGGPTARRLIALGLLSMGALAGCGGAQASESDIFHDPALRATSLAPGDDAERALLAQLASGPPAGVLAAGGVEFTLGEVYTAASGRDCRSVLRSERERLACGREGDDWTLVPSIVHRQADVATQETVGELEPAP